MAQYQNQSVPPYKQLRRPVDDRIVAGVCSGIARYAGIDPNVVRVVFAAAAILTWGTALLAYPVMWFIMPEERAATPTWPGASAPVSPPHPPAA